MKKLSLIVSAIIVFGSPIITRCQTKTEAAIRKNGIAKKKLSSSSSPLEEKEVARRRFWLSLALSSVFDSNIDHDEGSLDSFGLVPSAGLHYRDNVEKPSLEADYEVGLHRYTKTNTYDRVSQDLTVTYRRQLGRKFQARTTGEVSLKGSSEDRDVNNQYVFEQQMQYRFNPNSKVRAFAAYRVKRYPIIDKGKNAIDPYFGVRFDQTLRGDRAWGLMYRYDKNRSEDPKDRYVRWTYGAQYYTPLFTEHHDRLTFELRYAPRLYARQVKVAAVRVPRSDHRWVFDVLYERPLTQGVQMGWNYRLEKRNSNDPDKNFNSHLFGVAFAFHWWK